MRADKPIQQARNNLILSSVILCLTGLVFMIFSGTVVNIIGWVLGSIFCVVGLIYLIGYIRRQMFLSELFFGIISLVAGVLLLIHPGWIMSILSIIVGIYILIEGALKLKIALDARKQQARGWWVLLVIALISIGLSIVLIVNPFGISKIFIFLLGVALLLNGIENIIHAVYTKKILTDMSTEIIDMEDYVE
ncbi:MAG: DUF308 domain-containing protein [Bacteroides sp.]|nr:DUF308 domain-containing protein [Bacteroides sp.]MCM1550313.1 DUF308 domain-containing protein [Clostridium sp.]